MTSDGSELVAELILHPHACGPDCLCWELRKAHPIDEALQRLGAPKYQTISEAVDHPIEKHQTEKPQTTAKAG